MAYVRIRESGERWTGQQFERWLRSNGVTIPLEGIGAPGFIQANGADPVFEGPVPTGAAWQHAEYDGMAQIEGMWFSKWKLMPLVITPELLEEQRNAHFATAATLRWEKATGEFTFGGVTLKLDTVTTNNLDAAYIKATRNPAFVAQWSIDDRTFIELDAETIIMLGDAVVDYVQACFANQCRLAGLIAAATTYEELVAIDLNSGWPDAPPIEE